MGPLVECQQTEHAVHGGVGPGVGLVVGGQFAYVGVQALVVQRVQEAGGPRVVGAAFGQDDEPVPGGGGAARGGARGPVGAVAEAVRGGLGPALPAPGGEGGQEAAEGVRFAAVDGQDGRQLLEVLAFDGRPESGLARFGGGRLPLVVVGRVQPVPLTLEGVGGQVRAGGTGRAREGGPVDGDTVHEGGGDALGESDGFGAAGAQQRDENGLFEGGQTVLDHGGEDAAGADLHEGGDALGLKGAHGSTEADGFADLPHPVVGRAQFVFGGERAGHRGHHGDAGGVEGQTAGDAPEVLQHVVHVRGVEGVADPQPLGAAALCLPVGRDLGDGLFVARNDGGIGPVGGREGDVVLVAGETLADLVLGGLDRHHGAACGQRLHEGAARGDQPCGVVEGQHATDVGGGQLADGVSGDEPGCHAPGFDEPEQGGFQGEERGLGVGGLVEQGGLGAAFLGEDDVAQRPVQVWVQFGAHRVEGRGEHGVRGVQFAPHARSLGALPGEEERAGGLDGDAADQAVGGAARGEGVQAAQELLPVARDDYRAVFHEGPGVRERMGDGGRFEVGAVP